MIDHLAFGFQPFDDLDRAVGGDTFFVAGDQEGQRAIDGVGLRDGSDPGGNGALHVDGTTADQGAFVDFGAERIVAPQAADTAWDDVGVTGKTEIGRGRAATGVEVFDVAEPQARAGKAERIQMALDGVHRAGVGRGDGGLGDQFLCQGDGIEDFICIRHNPSCKTLPCPGKDLERISIK